MTTATPQRRVSCRRLWEEGYEVVEGLIWSIGGHPISSQANGLKVEERLVHLRMEVKFEVLIKKKKMYYLGLRRLDLWMEFWMVHLEELGMKKWWVLKKDACWAFPGRILVMRKDEKM
ncbi:hypothetical protein Tco_0065112 [Tanacetum coccineum]